MGFDNIKQYVDAELNGRTSIFSWRKSSSQTTAADYWTDLSMAPGNPVPNYYASTPLIAVQMKQSTHGGLAHGDSTSTKKIIKSTLAMSHSASGLPVNLKMLDYLLYYPFTDDGTTDEQLFNNSVGLPRYTDGEGVRVMAVSVAARTGNSTFSISYTNQDGVAGRTSRTMRQSSPSNVGHIATSGSGSVSYSSPFISLQAGDTGVRSIQSITMDTTDVGLMTLVLVKPIMDTVILEQTAPTEENLLIEKMSMPQIENDAYLNWICRQNGNLSGVNFYGLIQVIF